jgi:hypothetical protein
MSRIVMMLSALGNSALNRLPRDVPNATSDERSYLSPMSISTLSFQPSAIS